MKTFKLNAFFMIAALLIASCTDSASFSNTEDPALLENPAGETPEIKVPEEENASTAFDLETFFQERSAWEAQGIDNYTLFIKQTPGYLYLCEYALTRVDVKDGVYLYGYDMDLMPEEDLPRTFTPYYPPEGVVSTMPIKIAAEWWRSIANVYDVLFDIYEGFTAANEPLCIEIKYNEEYHYPEYVSYAVDHEYAKENINSKAFPKSSSLARESFILELYGLEKTEPLPKIMFDLEEFNREWAAWKAQGIENYSFDVNEWGALGPCNYRTTVEGKKIQNITIEQVTIPETIDDIYERVFSRYNECCQKLGDYEYFVLGIRYNEQYHYPEYVTYGCILHTKKGLPAGGLDLELSNFKITE